MATARLPSLDFEAMSAEEVLRWAAAEFGDRLCLTCSWQRQSSVLIHMLSELELDVDIVELDTMVLFPETYETRDRLVERYGLELTSFRPIAPPDRLWETKPDECCHIRKVEPLERALAGYERRRNELSAHGFQSTVEFARLQPPSAEQQQLFAALRQRPDDRDRLFGTLAGTVDPGEFWAPENLARILAPVAAAA